MKKQVKKFSKKIMVLGLATSIIFTSCFSYKKINAHATSVVAGLGAYTLYELCLYIGGLAVTTLGIGYAYENRDEIAEFGKSVIDSMSDLSSKEWVIGSHTVSGDYVYGTEALEEVQETQWSVIQGGGQSPKNDNDDDGDEDLDDRELELNLNGYFLTQAGINLFNNHIKPLYDNWINGENNNDNIFVRQYGNLSVPHFTGASSPSDGTYFYGNFIIYPKDANNSNYPIISDSVKADISTYSGRFAGLVEYGSAIFDIWDYSIKYDDYFSLAYDNHNIAGVDYMGLESRYGYSHVDADFPIFFDRIQMQNYLKNGDLTGCVNLSNSYYEQDWLNDINDLKNYLEDISKSLHSLQDLTQNALDLGNSILDNRPNLSNLENMVNDSISELPSLNVNISNPTYYPHSNTTPKLEQSDFPLYVPDPDVGGDDEVVDSVTDNFSVKSMYEICLYIGSLAFSSFGVGIGETDIDNIAYFGKSIIDSMSSVSPFGWYIGSYTHDGNFVYGVESIQDIQNTAWDTIVQYGNYSDKDLNSDGVINSIDTELLLNLNNYFLTNNGLSLFSTHFLDLYNDWVNCLDSENTYNDNILDDFFGYSFDSLSNFDTSNLTYLHEKFFVGGKYLDSNKNVKYISFPFAGMKYTDNDKFACLIENNAVYVYRYRADNKQSSTISYYVGTNGSNARFDMSTTKYFDIDSSVPIFNNKTDMENYFNNGIVSNSLNYTKSFRIADWLADDNYWRGNLEDLATSLRSLQDLFNIANSLLDNAFVSQPSFNEFADFLDNLFEDTLPNTYPINNPIYYPSTNPTPKLEPSVFPNYVPSTNPDIGGGSDSPDPPTDGGDEEVPEIDLDGLLSIFNILFYLIMIIVMLIYLFLSCLAFIVMIFRIPASSSMLPEDMVLGFEHLQTIMIPNTNISIYGFAMALIYLFIIFAVIKLIRLEINDFKFPRSYK